MTNMRKKGRDEDGFALLFAMLALLLLASIGLAMVFASDTETSIDSNYKDQTKAMYAAYSGLEEAKNRLRQGCGSFAATCTSIPWPAGAPTSSGTNYNVIYLINPKAGEIIQPWNPTLSGKPNPFYDWEICDSSNENMPAGFCTSGAPPNTAAKYTVYCDGAASDCTASSPSYNPGTAITAPWKRSLPLDYKWVRINLKTVDMNPRYTVTGSAGEIACWDGWGQVARGSGYKNDCTPAGGLNISLATPGSNWTSAPTITIDPPNLYGGRQATAVPVVTVVPSGISNALVGNPGAGYTSDPIVTVSGGSPTRNATVTAHYERTGSSIQSLSATGNITNAATDACFPTTSAPTVSLVGGSGAGATGTSTVAGTYCVAAISFTTTGKCPNYKNDPADPITLSGGGTGFAATVKFDSAGKINKVTITAGGTGFTSPSGLTVNGLSAGNCDPLTPSITLGTHITALAVGAVGEGYQTIPTVTYAPSPTSGNLPTTSIVLGPPSPSPGTIDRLTITDPGAGYTVAPTLIFSGGSPTTVATGTVSVTPTSTLTLPAANIDGGSGYDTIPFCKVTGGGQTITTRCDEIAGLGLSLNIALGATTYYGQVAELTSFAQTSVFGARQGAQMTSQMELATSVRTPASFDIGGAITMAGPSVIYNPPNSDPYNVNGNDSGTCGNGAAKPAIGVIDDPADPQGLVASVISAINGPGGKPANFTGSGAAPDVENAFSALGGAPTTEQLATLLAIYKSKASSTNIYTNAPAAPHSTYPLPSYTNLNNFNPGGDPPVNYVDGNLTLSGNNTGSGILVVTGTLTLSGDYHWNGLVLVIGQGVIDMQGGGNGSINGSLYVAKINDTNGNQLDTLGTSTINNSGGGGNGVYYNSCLADKYIQGLGKIAPDPATIPGKVLSVRTITRQ